MDEFSFHVDIRTGEEGLLLPIKAICAGHVAVRPSRLNEEGIQMFFLMEDSFLHLLDVFHTRFRYKFQLISLTEIMSKSSARIFSPGLIKGDMFMPLK